MNNEVIISSGVYTVGIDFPAGSYIFENINPENNHSGSIIYHFKISREARSKYFSFGKDCLKFCRLAMNEGDRIEVNGEFIIKKADALFQL